MRLNRVLRALGVAVSVWYGKGVLEPKKPGRKPQAVPEALAAQIRALAERYSREGLQAHCGGGTAGGSGGEQPGALRVFKAAGLL